MSFVRDRGFARTCQDVEASLVVDEQTACIHESDQISTAWISVRVEDIDRVPRIHVIDIPLRVDVHASIDQVIARLFPMRSKLVDCDRLGAGGRERNGIPVPVRP